MKKLTLEKAQELLEFLKGKAATGDITMSQENYLQAMELAVMALEAQARTSLRFDISALSLSSLSTVEQFIANAKESEVGALMLPGDTPSVPAVSFYRDGIIAAADWVDESREAFERESGQHDPDTGTFEFSNDADREYSCILFDVAEGIRQLHPNAVSGTIDKPFKDVAPNDVVPVGNDYFRVRYVTHQSDDTTLHLQREAEQLSPFTQNDVIFLSVANSVPLMIAVKAAQ